MNQVGQVHEVIVKTLTSRHSSSRHCATFCTPLGRRAWGERGSLTKPNRGVRRGVQTSSHTVRSPYCGRPGRSAAAATNRAPFCLSQLRFPLSLFTTTYPSLSHLNPLCAPPPLPAPPAEAAVAERRACRENRAETCAYRETRESPAGGRAGPPQF